MDPPDHRKEYQHMQNAQSDEKSHEDGLSNQNEMQASVHEGPGLTTISTQNLAPFSIKPPAFASASQQALVDQLHQPYNMYAIETSVVPVARESGDDSEFFEYLNHLFGEGNDGSLHPPNSNVQFLLDPIAWLSKESSPPEKVPAAASTEHVVRPSQLQHQGQQVSSSQVVRAKTSSRKTPPVKAAVGKIKEAVGATKYRRQASKTGSSQLSPFDFLKDMLAARGYSFATIKSVEAGYMVDPSPLQLASFGTKLVNAAHNSDVAELSLLLGCGLSPNPCNQFRDSVIDWALRKGNEAVFRCFFEHHADVRVCDGFGRTPLHHAAWAETFSPNITIAILQHDPVQFFLEDNNGRAPLEYVPAKLTTQWIAFIENHKESLFPLNGPPLTVAKRQHSRLPDPPNALSVDLARLVSSGQLQPEQVAAMDELSRRTWKLPE